MKPLCASLPWILIVPFVALPSFGQISPSEIEAMEQAAKSRGWTFTVGETTAMSRSIEELCGFQVSDAWLASVPPAKSAGTKNAKSLPAVFDWRTAGGTTPVRDQGGCGSCWAFAMMGTLEGAIKIADGIEEDLSEQWLVSCNTEGFGCAGSVWLFDYFTGKKDKCG